MNPALARLCDLGLESAAKLECSEGPGGVSTAVLLRLVSDARAEVAVRSDQKSAVDSLQCAIQAENIGVTWALWGYPCCGACFDCERFTPILNTMTHALIVKYSPQYLTQ